MPPGAARRVPGGRAHLVVVGASLGGLDAVPAVLGRLPLDLGAAIVIVQHRRGSGSGLLDLLSSRLGREVVEPEHANPIEPGGFYLAPADYHLLIEPGTFALSTEAPVLFARPSIDVTLDTAARSFGKDAAAVILTGSSADGARGARAVAAAGGTVLVQDPSEAYSPAAPKAALEAVASARRGRLAELAEQLLALCRPRVGSRQG